MSYKISTYLYRSFGYIVQIKLHFFLLKSSYFAAQFEVFYYNGKYSTYIPDYLFIKKRKKV